MYDGKPVLIILAGDNPYLLSGRDYHLSFHIFATNGLP
jgi:hypothetical protein